MKAKPILLFASLCATSLGQALVFSAPVRSTDGVGFDEQLLLGTIEGRANERISILRIAIGGDADANSGKQAFQAVGGGIDFVWAAGQQVNPPFSLDYVLDPTVQTTGDGRTLSHLGIAGEQIAAAGASVDIIWRGTADWDGRWTLDTDPLGSLIDDSALRASARAWVQYEYEPVPEPASIAAFALGLGALMRRRRRR
ncbi:MAG: PEP-CTERM sorting domain-containing protein [Fimbriimonadaceae bacterium]